MNTWKTVIVLLLGLILTATIPVSAEEPVSTPSIPENQTLQPWPSQNQINITGTQEPMITLVLLQSNNTKMPGPRDMAFGPSSIMITSNRSSLVAVTLATIILLAGFIIFMRRR